MVNSGRADAFGRLQLGFGVGARADAQAGAAAAARQLRQRVERLDGAAELIDELAEGDRSDIAAADQAQTGKPLCCIQMSLR
jgi:alkanesulfonate monooxygenase SsuD/methylene tetrahydromethanopterin reductase-like flavin-dependent oxidoreductase (luciferase family)